MSKIQQQSPLDQSRAGERRKQADETENLVVVHPNRKHGHSKSEMGGKSTRTYRSWRAMKTRCLNKNVPDFFRYGGRGITVCERWLHSFENFFSDMGERPAGLTLDRYPHKNGNYTPSNCRWATGKQQGRNTRANLMVVCFGKKVTAVEAAEKCGHNYNTLLAFLRNHKDFTGDISNLHFPPLRKLSWSKVRRIRLAKSSQSKIASRFGVSKSLIRAIQKKQIWK